MDYLPYLLVGVVAGLGAGFGLAILLAGGWAPFSTALRLSRRMRSDVAFAEKVAALDKPPPPPKPSGAPLRLLAILQRDGRLIDFLLEDIQGVADDAQVGAAVRDIHKKSQQALKEHLVLDAVLPQNEGDSVEVPAGFDPSAIRVTGNVPANPPYRGTLLHRGWRVKTIQLAPLPEGQDEFVLQPAEVEVP